MQYADMFIFAALGTADLWINPETGEELGRCPFLRKVRNKPLCRCRIYETRPRMCEQFPHLEYDERGELVGVHSWALDNCPGVKALLRDWTPEQIQVLRDRREAQRAAALREKPGRPALSPERVETRRRICSWCKNKMAEDATVYVVGLKGKPESALEAKGRAAIPVFLTTLGDVVYAFGTVEGSEGKRRGLDFEFMTCSQDCTASLQAALHQEMGVV